jgi:DNA-binding NarL/FixJ family response regulator
MSSHRVLVVDDYEPFRRLICSTLAKRPDLQVVGEASDGLEAVHRAEELQPDLIVLDIGLGTLNGIEAARRIRKLCPQCKILFLTQESSADVAQEAFSLGAMGYVVKAHAGGELLAALEEVCQGRQFVSRGLSGHSWASAADAQAPDQLLRQEVLPSLVPRKAEIVRGHEVQFYSDDESFLDGFTRYIEVALLNGNAVIMVATESHQKRLLQRLQDHGVMIADAIKQGRCLPLDVVDTLSTFMVNDLPDPMRFYKVVGDLIATAAQATAGEPSRVTICGECASILWAQGNADAAIQVEQLCNQLTKHYEMDILCGFSLSSFYCDEDKQIFQRICGEIEPLSR